MMYDYAPVIREGKIVCLVTQLRLKSLSGNDCKAECVTIGWELTQTSNLQYWREKITIRPIDEISSIKTSCLKNNQNFNLFIVPWSIKCGGEKQRSGRSLSGSTESSLAAHIALLRILLKDISERETHQSSLSYCKKQDYLKKISHAHRGGGGLFPNLTKI